MKKPSVAFRGRNAKEGLQIIAESGQKLQERLGEKGNFTNPPQLVQAQSRTHHNTTVPFVTVTKFGDRWTR